MHKSTLVFLNILFLIILIILAILFIKDTNESNYELYNYLFCVFGTIIYFICIWSWYKLRKEILCPYVLFISAAFAFMFGQSILTALGIPINARRDLHLRYSTFTMLKANIFTCLGLYALHNGALISARGNITGNEHVDIGIDKDKEKTNGWSEYLFKGTQVVGWILFIISIGPTITQLLKLLRLVSIYGYGIIYDESLVRTGLQKWDSILQQFFVPSLICLFISSQKNKYIKWFSIFCMAIHIVSTFYLGGRSKGVVLALCLFCMWHYMVKPIRGFKALLSIVCGIIFISFMPVIFKLRSLAERSFFNYIELFLISIGKENLFIEAISEMGGSMFPLINVMLLVPDIYSFRCGESYLYSILTIIPNLGFWKVHPSAVKANLGDWLQAALGLGYGPGFSMTAEAYINFGWLGIPFMLLLGCFYGRIFSLVNRKEKIEQYNPAVLSFVFSALSLTMMTVRNSFIGTVRAFLYFCVPMYIMCIIIANYLERNDKMSKNSIKSIRRHNYKMGKEM